MIRSLYPLYRIVGYYIVLLILIAMTFFTYQKVFYVDPIAKHQRPTFYFIWLVESIFMAIIILPWYIYFVIHRSQLQTKAAMDIKYTLLDFEKIHLGEKLEDWKEISNATNSHVNVKDEDIQGKHIAKVYRSSENQRDTSSKTAQEDTTESIRSSKLAKLVSTNSIISDNDTDGDSISVSNSVTGSESTKVPGNKLVPIQLGK